MKHSVSIYVLIFVSEPAEVKEASVSGPVNSRSHVSRLGLARALSRSADTQDQAKQLYQEAIAMAPGVSWCPSYLRVFLFFFFSAFNMQLK